MRGFILSVGLTLCTLIVVPVPVASQPCSVNGLFDEQVLPATVAGQFATTVGDLNADGIPDLLASTTGLIVRHGLAGAGGAIAYQSPTFYQTASEPREIAIADFNSDGALDVAVACLGGGVKTGFKWLLIWSPES
jgi:hypothetical protein